MTLTKKEAALVCQALHTAQSVGEIHFRTCVLSSTAADRIAVALEIMEGKK